MSKSKAVGRRIGVLGVFVCGVAALGLAATPATAQCPDGIFSSSLGVEDPTFNRPFVLGSGCSPSGVGTDVFYEVYTFDLAGPGPHDLLASLCGADGGSAAFDSVLVVYQAPDGSANPFDPNSPCGNAYLYNDDSCGLQSFIADNTLVAGEIQIVVTTFSNGAGGGYDLVTGSTTCAAEGACCTNGPGTETECVVATRDDCEGGDGLFLGEGSECTSDIDCQTLAVAFDSMSATATRDGVVVQWKTSMEIDHVAFRVLREVSGSREKRLDVVAEVPARGAGLLGASYEVTDTSRQAHIALRYYIETLDLYGRTERHGPITVDYGRR